MSDDSYTIRREKPGGWWRIYSPKNEVVTARDFTIYKFRFASAAFEFAKYFGMLPIRVVETNEGEVNASNC